jgi:post-segregation antitoxin (ccd killing protein)
VVICEERNRLKSIQLSAVLKHLQVPRESIAINSTAWKQATKKTQKECNEALAELNRHKKENGC